jgi:hypothetical protein
VQIFLVHANEIKIERENVRLRLIVTVSNLQKE